MADEGTWLRIWILSLCSPLIHGIVDHGVDAAVGHGQPVEGQEHVRGVPGLHDGGVVEGVDEVGVVWQPAHSKYKGHSTKQQEVDQVVAKME